MELFVKELKAFINGVPDNWVIYVEDTEDMTYVDLEDIVTSVMAETVVIRVKLRSKP